MKKLKLKKEQSGTDKDNQNSKPGQSRVGTASDPGRFGDIGVEEPSV